MLIFQVSKSSRIIKIIFLLLGGLCLIGGVYSVWHTRQQLARYEHTSGIVVDNSAYRSSRGSTTFAPVVEFKLKDGTLHKWTSNVSTNKLYMVGEPIGIYYDPTNPDQAYVDSFFFKYGLGLVLIFFGSVVLLSAIFPSRKSASSPVLDIAQKAQHDPELAQAFKTIAKKMEDR